MSRLLVFGPGYAASRIAAACMKLGWQIETIGRDGITDRTHVAAAIGRATHILSSVPPAGDADPVLAAHGDLLARCDAEWIGYLSSTGVYGDTGGAWVDEGAPLGGGRRSARTAADLDWQALHPQVRIFRLPGIYGPGRSVLDRIAAGAAHRVDIAGQVFSRVHVDDIVGGVLASIDRGPPGVYNIADDLPAPQNILIEAACVLLGCPVPLMQSLETAGLSAAARAFYAENRRVANGKAKRLLGWRPLYPDYRAGLRALSAIASPASASIDPSAASSDQR
jgi:nucleoside-diphosphate-sugar epimerase